MISFNLEKCIIKGLVLLVFNCAINFSYAQYSAEYLKYSEMFPKSPYVRINQERVITIKNSEGELDISQEFHIEDIYLKESATSFGSKETLSYSAFFSIEEIEAFSYIFEKGKYKPYEVSDFKESDDLDDSFYDDQKTITFYYPKLEKGAKTKLRYKEKLNSPRFLSTFYYGETFPIINNKLTIIVDNDVTMKFKEFNTDSIDIEYTSKEKGKKVIHTWQTDMINAYDYEMNVKSYQKILPHIVPVITSFQTQKGEKHLARNVSDLFNWYDELTKDLNSDEPSAELKKLVDELTFDKSNKLDKAKAIYYWAQQNIKYIDFEYALGGFVPREANKVFKNKYGDCKDNSSIMQEMFKLAGLEGYLTWVGTRKIAYSYEAMPTPKVDNHMILTFDDGNSTFYLDATGRFTPITMPTSFIQGKEVLIAIGDNAYEVRTVPVVNAENNLLEEHTTLKLDSDKLRGQSKIRASGYVKTNLFQELERKNTENKLLAFYNNRFKKGSNKFLIQKFEENNKYSYDDDFILEYDFNLVDYAKKIGDEIYINLNLNKVLEDFEIDEKRVHDFDFDYKKLVNYENVLEVPNEYEITYVPEDYSFSNDYFSVSVTYSKSENKMLYKHVAQLNFLTLNKEQQKEFNSILKKVENAYREIVILKKK